MKTQAISHVAVAHNHFIFELCTDVYPQIKIPIVCKCVFACSQKLKNGDKVDHLTAIMPMHMQDLVKL